METRQRRRDSLAKWIVKHDQDKQMFYIDLDKDNTSLLNYRLFDDGKSVELYHTEVPQQFSRQGIGTVLAKHALEYFERNGTKMTITCSFIDKVYRSYSKSDKS